MTKQDAKIFKCDNLRNKCFEVFQEMKVENRLCDITIQAGNRSIFAHRVILTAVIPYFRNITEIKESIDLSNLESGALTCLIDYAYSCEVSIDENNARNLLNAACFLGIYEVKDACCDFLSDGLEAESAWSIRELAISVECPRLKDDADSYIMENFNITWKTNDFLNYSFNYLKELIEKDDLNVDNEEQVLDAVLRWVKQSPHDRRDELPELLCAVRMSLIEPLYLANIVLKEEMIRTSVLCRDIVDEGRNYVFPEIRERGCRFKTQPRENKKAKFACHEEIDNPCMFVLCAKEIYGVQCVNLLEGTQVTKECETFDVLSGSAVHLQNRIYFFHSNTVLQYDAGDNTYEKVSSMEIRREHFGVTALKNKIYVCGGRTYCWEPSDAVECYDTEEDEWTTLKSLRTSRWGLSVTNLGGYIFALGGVNNETVFDTVETYDPKRGKWTSIASMLTEKCYAGVAILNGKIFICGGQTLNVNAVSTSEVYDPIDDKWVFISSMKLARCDFTLLSCRGKLYAIGGIDDEQGKVQTIDVYDPEDDEWTDEWISDILMDDHPISGAVVMTAEEA